jgi:site-specific recombinase XerD
MTIVDPAGATRFAAASAHRLRHMHGSHAVVAGVDLKVVQENLGHASVATTTHYTSSEERRARPGDRETVARQRVAGTAGR